MVLICMMILHYSGKGFKASIHSSEWILLIIGSLIVIFAYIQDYSNFMLNKFAFSDFIFIKDKEAVLAHASHYIPQKFNWYIFGLGQTLLFVATGLYILRMRKQVQ